MEKIAVTAAIMREQGKFLICQRAKDDELPMLWEFPGGKLEKGETLEQCIVREIMEELSLEIKVISIYEKTIYQFNQMEVHFTFFNVEIISGDIILNVHNDAKWVLAKDIKNYEFMPPDIEIAQRLSDAFQNEE